MTLKPRPSRPTEGQLKKAGVTIMDSSRFWLQCDECGETWSPNIQRGGKMPRGYWHCPNGCNTPQVATAILVN